VRGNQVQLDNAVIAELLARESETAPNPAARALRRAARKAFLWDTEAFDLASRGEPLTELNGVGPFIARKILRWLEKPPSDHESPPIRSGFLTLTKARDILATKPNWMSRVNGDLQMHTTWSDGEGSVAEMAEAAYRFGYRYIAVTDHAKGLKIAGGIDEGQLQKQGAEIGSLNAHLTGLKVLRSIELNLNPAGRGDMDSAALRQLDLVLGCFHSSLRRPEDQTERYIEALRNPDIQILGHPRGRIYNHRLGLKANWKKVFDVAAELDKAVEIDGYPDRQDLNIALLRIAKRSGCRISLGTDSHGPSQLRFMAFSAAAALAAGIAPGRILNFMNCEGLRAWVESVRSSRT
jgi:histidinol phosphatase-like PHP family hydrolase